MGSVVVDQIGSTGELLADFDTTLTPAERHGLFLDALPGATVASYAGGRAVIFQDQLILSKQITYLGIPWEPFKKRIQIPGAWKDAYRQAGIDGLKPRFMGVYRYRDVTIFVDFDPGPYVRRRANNSAAHVATNDLYQAQTLGLFSREDRNGNRLTSIRSDLLAGYLLDQVDEQNPCIAVFEDFNSEFLTHRRLEALDAVREMHAAEWPDRFHAEWAGFYLEYRVHEFTRRNRVDDLVMFQKAKRKGAFDYDLVLRDRSNLMFYGDLKASNVEVHTSPGNDAEALRLCIAEFGRFWYVIYEHETWHSRDEGDLPVVEWNEWKRSVGFDNGKDYNAMSYAGRFKSAVRFDRMMILEINEANFGVVLGSFQEGFRQQDGSMRKEKVMIQKKHLDNFLIYSSTVD